MEWKPYDPAWLADWVRANVPEEPWLADALARCVRAMGGGPAYVYFVDPADANHERSIDNLRRLELASHAPEVGPLRIVQLPFPGPVLMSDERLPASYANFYIANGVVIVPTFNDPNDRVALNTLVELFPTRHVVGIHSRDLVWGLGTLHCLTQQEFLSGPG